jgi:hypothetical protein
MVKEQLLPKFKNKLFVGNHWIGRLYSKLINISYLLIQLMTILEVIYFKINLNYGQRLLLKN